MIEKKENFKREYGASGIATASKIQDSQIHELDQEISMLTHKLELL